MITECTVPAEALMKIIHLCTVSFDERDQGGELGSGSPGAGTH
jgi:hypothetical protein